MALVIQIAFGDVIAMRFTAASAEMGQQSKM
jgi:hypothetical protein